MNKATEGMGKKIVDALKQQSDIEIHVSEENLAEDNNIAYQSELIDNSDDFASDDFNTNDLYNAEPAVYTTPNVMTFSTPVQEKETFAADLDGFDIPTNVAILKQLINQLPSGVSKQTGALIIKQTMEALGISMKVVLQEAQQVQENLNNSTRECQASIMEHRKQIGVLERQSQKFQRQSSALNDIISLFVQTNI